tara:strand:+ start:513 stop:749 length:237 start_codon:yes stop_codon:yes gene_type:complete
MRRGRPRPFGPRPFGPRPFGPGPLFTMMLITIRNFFIVVGILIIIGTIMTAMTGNKVKPAASFGYKKVKSPKKNRNKK